MSASSKIERPVVADLATAVEIAREVAMRAAGDPTRRKVACALLDAISNDVVGGVLECAE